MISSVMSYLLILISHGTNTYISYDDDVNFDVEEQFLRLQNGNRA
jgi:hypothetical protein